MTRVLVTGAAGFVGRAVVPQLLARGWAVRAVLRRPVEGAGTAGVEPVVTGDLAALTDWAPLLEGVDTVVHLAARVHVMGEQGGDRGAEALERYRQVNVVPTARLARAAAAAGVRRLLLMSSVKALGEGGSGAGALLGAATVPAPADPYGRSKLEAEAALAAVDGLSWVVLRPPLVYGPGVGANFLRLLKWVDRGVPLPLGAVRNRRSLVFVGNLAAAVVHGLEHPAAAGQCFLVHDGQALAVSELIRRLAAALDRPARLVPVPTALLGFGAGLIGARAAYTRLCGSLEVDDSAFRTATGWQPPFTIEEGLRATVAWYRDPHGSGGSGGGGQNRAVPK